VFSVSYTFNVPLASWVRLLARKQTGGRKSASVTLEARGKRSGADVLSKRAEQQAPVCQSFYLASEKACEKEDDEKAEKMPPEIHPLLLKSSFSAVSMPNATIEYRLETSF